MHQDIEAPSGTQARVWRSGVVLHRDQTRAEVIEDYGQRTITVRVSGEQRRDLMTIVAYELGRIYQTYHGLDYQQLIPCNCGQCQGSQDPYFYQLENLRRRLSSNRHDVECERSYERVSVRGLIDDVLDEGRFAGDGAAGASDRYGPTQIFNIQEAHMNIPQGDQFDQSGNRGSFIGVGRSLNVSIDTLTQIWNENAFDPATLAEELARLREQMLQEATAGEDYVAVGAVADAEQAARAGNGPKVLELLGKVGQWGLGIASKAGTQVAEAAIRTSIKATTGL